MIRDANIDPVYSQFAVQVASLAVTANSTSISRAGRFVAPFPGKIVSAIALARTVTGTVPVDVRKNGVSILGATPDFATTVVPLTVTTTVLATGDIVDVIATTGSGESVDGDVTLVWRPYLGSQERVGAGLGNL